MPPSLFGFFLSMPCRLTFTAFSPCFLSLNKCFYLIYRTYIINDFHWAAGVFFPFFSQTEEKTPSETHTKRESERESCLINNVWKWIMYEMSNGITFFLVKKWHRKASSRAPQKDRKSKTQMWKHDTHTHTHTCMLSCNLTPTLALSLPEN